MIERHLNSVEDVTLLIQWMQAPPDRKPVVPFDANHYLERLQLADQWLRTHTSKRKVWPMLFAHFKTKGIQYSEITARRDCDDAQRLFESLDSHQMKWWTGHMLDVLGESLMSAKIAHKYSEVARIAKAIYDYLVLAERLGIKDNEDLRREIPRLIEIGDHPEVLGIEYDPNIREKAEALIAEMRKRKFSQIPAATIVPDHDSGPAGD